MKNYLSIIGRVGGAILIIFGLHYVGLIQDTVFEPGKKDADAFLFKDWVFVVISVWNNIFIWMGALCRDDSFSNTAACKQDGNITAGYSFAGCLFGRAGAAFYTCKHFYKFLLKFF